MGSPEKPMDLEMGDMSDETKQLNPSALTDEKPKEKDEPIRFTGLKKEELLEISNQKKWVVTRWILFILFWVAWVAMLVGAIVIVIKAPRCKDQPSPAWHQDTVVYEAAVSKFTENNDISEVEKHLDYLAIQHVRALSLTDVTEPNDFAIIKAEYSSSFGTLSATAKTLKHPINVIAKMRIEVLGTSSTPFTNSANCNGTNNIYCDFFFWSSDPNATTDASSQWVLDATRNERYKADISDPTLAYVNYGNDAAKSYIGESLKNLVTNYKLDGLHLTDIAMITNSAEVVDIVRTSLNASDDSPYGLLLSSSEPDPVKLANSINYKENDTYAPLLINEGLPSMEMTAGIGMKMKEAITTWRNTNGNDMKVTGYALNPSTKSGLLVPQTKNSALAAAIELLNIVLPGIPILKSGDETGSSDAQFVWDEQILTNVTNNDLKRAIATTNQARVENYAVLPSLRWDRSDQYANLTFIDFNHDILSFTRKWDTKPTVAVVSNLSPHNHTLDLTKISGTGKVVSSSNGQLKEDSKIEKMTEVDVPSGYTLIFKF